MTADDVSHRVACADIKIAVEAANGLAIIRYGIEQRASDLPSGARDQDLQG